MAGKVEWCQLERHDKFFRHFLTMVRAIGALFFLSMSDFAASKIFDDLFSLGYLASQQLV